MFEKENISKYRLKEAGVTLMALVITIIVLLILAGITIQMSLDDNGIIKQAQRAKNTYESSRDDEQLALGQVSNAIQDAMNSTGGSSGSGGSSGGGSNPGENPDDTEKDDLKKQVDELKKENDELKDEIDRIKGDSQKLKDENDDLKAKQATGNATPEQVLSGATFSTASKIGQTGSMPINEGSDNVKNDKAWTYNNRVYMGIPYGYYPSGTFGGLENVSERYITFASLANAVGLTNTKLAVGQNVLGVNGTFTSDANATSDNNSNGKVAYVNGQRIVGNGSAESNSYNSGYNNGYQNKGISSATVVATSAGACSVEYGAIYAICGVFNNVSKRVSINISGATILNRCWTYSGGAFSIDFVIAKATSNVMYTSYDTPYNDVFQITKLNWG